MKLTIQERLKFLARAAERAEQHLEALRTSEAQFLGQRDFPALIQKAEEVQATAEALLLLAVERDLLWSNASEGMSMTTAETPAPAHPTPDAEKF